MKLDDIKTILSENNFSPNKKFGQNFLADDNILRKIIESSAVSKNDTVLEIGPGLGFLTSHLAVNAMDITAVEIDAGYYNYLKNRYQDLKNLELIHNDFLKIHLDKPFTKVIANLPYYCSSEILFYIAQNYNIPEVYIMLQKEMAERLISSVGSKTYGAFTVSLGLYYHIEILFTVGHNCFFPKPEVDSSFVKLVKNDQLLNDGEKKMFHTVVKSAFWGRRKTIANSLSNSPHYDFDKTEIINALQNHNINISARAEELSLNDYISLTKEFYHNNGSQNEKN